MTGDALDLWEISAGIAAAIGLALKFGRLPARGYWITRSEQPGPFWFVITLLGFGLVVSVFCAVYATLPDSFG